MAVLFQENRFIFSYPLALRDSRSSASFDMRAKALRIKGTDVGQKNSAASPAPSGREPAVEQATGTPIAMASSKGKPKPSYNDGNIKKPAPPRIERTVWSGR